MGNYTFYSDNRLWSITFSARYDPKDNYRITKAFPVYISHLINYDDPGAIDDVLRNIWERIMQRTRRDIRKADNFSIPINDVIWRDIIEAAQQSSENLKNKVLAPPYKNKAEELGLDMSNPDLWRDLHNLVNSLSSEGIVAKMEAMDSDEELISLNELYQIIEDGGKIDHQAAKSVVDATVAFIGNKEETSLGDLYKTVKQGGDIDHQEAKDAVDNLVSYFAGLNISGTKFKVSGSDALKNMVKIMQRQYLELATKNTILKK